MPYFLRSDKKAPSIVFFFSPRLQALIKSIIQVLNMLEAEPGKPSSSWADSMGVCIVDVDASRQISEKTLESINTFLRLLPLNSCATVLKVILD